MGMGIRRIVSVIIVAWAVVSGAWATDFATKGLERLAVCTGLNELDNLSIGTHYIYLNSATL